MPTDTGGAWRPVRLGEVSRSFAGGTPSRARPELYGPGIPWLKSGEVRAGRIETTEETITPAALKESSARVAKAGTPVIAMYGATAGVAGILAIDAALNQAVLAVEPKREVLDAEFCFQLLHAHTSRLLALAQGSGQPNLSKTLLDGLEILLPPLDEQRRIAEVLRSADEAIEKAELVASSARSARMSLLADLFHRADWEPQRVLPCGWHTPLLDTVARRGSGHTPSKQFSTYWDGDVKWISLQDTKQLDRVYIAETAAAITPEGLANSSAVLHPANTVVVSRDATVGRSAIMMSDMAVSQHFITYTCGPTLSPLYLYYWLQRMKPVFERIGAGSTIKTIGLPFFKGLKIAIPDRTKQDRAADLLWRTDSQVFASEAATTKLRSVKAAVSDDLLSGRVRVPV